MARVVPRPTAPSIAVCIVALHEPLPPRLRLITSAGLALAGTPLTLPPEAQTIASAISEMEPPPTPSTRTGEMRALNAVPATPLALLVSAATVPATWVPCQLDWPLVESPGSLGSESRPPPSLATVVSLMKS